MKVIKKVLRVFEIFRWFPVHLVVARPLNLIFQSLASLVVPGVNNAAEFVFLFAINHD